MSVIKNQDPSRHNLFTLSPESRSIAIAAADTSEVLIGGSTTPGINDRFNQEVLITSSGAVFIHVSDGGTEAATDTNGLFINGAGRYLLPAGYGITVISGDANTVVSVMTRGILAGN